MGSREYPLPLCFDLLLGKDRDRWPPEARFIRAAHFGDMRGIKKFAKELDVQGNGIPATVANTCYMGMNALHAASGLGRLPVYQYLVEEVKMDIHKPDTTQGYTPVEHAVSNGHLPAVRLPIELAAEHGTREDVEILFPFTSPISTVENWSVDGIISHVNMEIKQLEDGKFVKNRMADLKQQADEAFKKQDYLNSSVLYTQALKIDNFNATLLSNRSLCWLRMGDGERVFNDATECTKLRPKWAKAHYRQGAAQMFMKEYDGAYHALSRALELDPESEETEKLFWEAMELR